MADRALYAALRRLDRHELRRVLVFVRGLLRALGDDAAERPAGPRVSFRLERVSCGKTGCTKCPHGPYWYAYYRDGGRTRSRYIGRTLPDEVRRAAGAPD